MATRHTARGIVLHNKQLLLIERWRPGMHYFSIPGGAIEPGETPEKTTVREILEETSCTVAVERLLYQLTSPDGNEHYIFLCNFISGEPKLTPDSPEALNNDLNNQFKPRWINQGELAELPSNIWQPVFQQLAQDLNAGFVDTVQTLAWNG